MINTLKNIALPVTVVPVPIERCAVDRILLNFGCKRFVGRTKASDFCHQLLCGEFAPVGAHDVVADSVDWIEVGQ